VTLPSRPGAKPELIRLDRAFNVRRPQTKLSASRLGLDHPALRELARLDRVPGVS